MSADKRTAALQKAGAALQQLEDRANELNSKSKLLDVKIKNQLISVEDAQPEIDYLQHQLTIANLAIQTIRMLAEMI